MLYSFFNSFIGTLFTDFYFTAKTHASYVTLHLLILMSITLCLCVCFSASNETFALKISTIDLCSFDANFVFKTISI